jgi:hypothetical protein
MAEGILDETPHPAISILVGDYGNPTGSLVAKSRKPGLRIIRSSPVAYRQVGMAVPRERLRDLLTGYDVREDCRAKAG